MEVNMGNTFGAACDARKDGRLTLILWLTLLFFASASHGDEEIALESTNEMGVLVSGELAKAIAIAVHDFEKKFEVLVKWYLDGDDPSLKTPQAIEQCCTFKGYNLEVRKLSDNQIFVQITHRVPPGVEMRNAVAVYTIDISTWQILEKNYPM